MEDLFDRIIKFALANVTWLIFLLFMLSGLFSRGNKADQTTRRPQQAQPRQRPTAQSADNRPLSERMAEAFGMQEVMEEVRREQAQQQRTGRRQQSQGRRSTTTGNVQDNYPELFGGNSLFEDRDQQWGLGKTKFGFDETEWGSTFDKNEEQWGSTFPDRKSSEPTIEWPK